VPIWSREPGLEQGARTGVGRRNWSRELEQGKSWSSRIVPDNNIANQQRK